MKNLVIKVQNFEGNYGQNYRALNATLDGKNINTTHVGHGIAEFSEQSIQMVIQSAILNDFTAFDLTVDAPLSDGAKTAISDRYAGDPLVTSIVFA